MMGKHGVLPARVDMFGPGGTAQLDALDLPLGYSSRLESLRKLIGVYDREVTALDRRIASRLANHAGTGRSRPSTVSARSSPRCS